MGEENLPGTYYQKGDGQRFYYFETTGAGRSISEKPDSIKGTNASLIKITGYSVLTGLVTGTGTTEGGAPQFEITLRNENPYRGDNVSVRIEIQDQDKRTVSEKD